MPDRDLFANFERMRREMEELFGDVFSGSGLAPRGRSAFAPRVDVYYVPDPNRAVVEVALAGLEPGDISLEVTDRELVISGERRRQEAPGRVYQQIEIAQGPFRRAIQLGADVRAEDAVATYEGGILRVELPLVESGAQARTVPVSRPAGDVSP
jgi:HSP20 family protein